MYYFQMSLEKFYHKSIFIFWILFQSPMLLLIILYLFFAYNYFRIYGILLEKEIISFKIIPGFFTRTLLKLNVFFFKEATENLPHHFLTWITPNKEEQEFIMKAIDPKKPHEYVCKSEQKRPKEEQTVFTVRYLTATETAQYRDTLYKVEGFGKNRKETIKSGSADLETLRHGLMGWRNLQDESGKEVTFDKTNLAGMMDLLPPDVRQELANHIRGESEVDEGED